MDSSGESMLCPPLSLVHSLFIPNESTSPARAPYSFRTVYCNSEPLCISFRSNMDKCSRWSLCGSLDQLGNRANLETMRERSGVTRPTALQPDRTDPPHAHLQWINVNCKKTIRQVLINHKVFRRPQSFSPIWSRIFFNRSSSSDSPASGCMPSWRQFGLSDHVDPVLHGSSHVV